MPMIPLCIGDDAERNTLPCYKSTVRPGLLPYPSHGWGIVIIIITINSQCTWVVLNALLLKDRVWFWFGYLALGKTVLRKMKKA